jgi:hypothetical protein
MGRSTRYSFVSCKTQSTEAEPTPLGIDQEGLNGDFETGRAVVEVFQPVLDRRLRQRFGVKLLGVWPFGPQVSFCRKPVKGLAEQAGLGACSLTWTPRSRKSRSVALFDCPAAVLGRDHRDAVTCPQPGPKRSFVCLGAPPVPSVRLRETDETQMSDSKVIKTTN